MMALDSNEEHPGGCSWDPSYGEETGSKRSGLAPPHSVLVTVGKEAGAQTLVHLIPEPMLSQHSPHLPTQLKCKVRPGL